MKNKSGFLVRWRYALLVLTAAAALISVLLIPRTRINADMTSNLPDDSHHPADVIQAIGSRKQAIGSRKE